MVWPYSNANSFLVLCQLLLEFRPVCVLHRSRRSRKTTSQRCCAMRHIKVCFFVFFSTPFITAFSHNRDSIRKLQNWVPKIQLVFPPFLHCKNGGNSFVESDIHFWFWYWPTVRPILVNIKYEIKIKIKKIWCKDRPKRLRNCFGGFSPLPLIIFPTWEHCVQSLDQC